LKDIVKCPQCLEVGQVLVVVEVSRVELATHLRWV
jgi:hypothetical protein